MTTSLGPDTRVADVVRAAQRAGRTVHVIPVGQDKAETLARFAQVLRFPAWFGHNLDALADSLGDWASARPGPTTLVWDATAALTAADPDTAAMVEQILAEVEAAHADLAVVVIRR